MNQKRIRAAIFGITGGIVLIAGGADAQGRLRNEGAPKVTKPEGVNIAPPETGGPPGRGSPASTAGSGAYGASNDAQAHPVNKETPAQAPGGPSTGR